MSEIIVALDYSVERDALLMADKLDPELCKLKVGKELFTSCGPSVVNQLHKRGFKVFLDLKFHDIPNTVAKACKAASDLGVWMVNVHAMGGIAMMEAARKAVNEAGPDKPHLIAVTLLTSSGVAELEQLGIKESPVDFVKRLARSAQLCELDGVVCSAQEARDLRKQCGHKFMLVSPGIRPADATLNDQQRVATPVEAKRDGVNCMVIGRPITQAADPNYMLREILNSI
ncbi:MAG TPA: orotidine-5'-phosphate decarboxylase [Pseudomonadales bacterium]|nr:orotidine-5'-phosphate decarboxylase [Pseudomonadales bacterium]